MFRSSPALMCRSKDNPVRLFGCWYYNAYSSSRHYSDTASEKPKINRVITPKDDRTQLHFRIINDPKLTLREKHIMVSALIADVKFFDEEYGKLVYADPYGRDVLQFMKTRQLLPLIGIPAACIIAYFIPYSIYIQAAMAGVVSTLCVTEFYRAMTNIKKRIFFIYYEPQHQVYTALNLTGLHDFQATHFSEEDFQPSEKDGPHKVMLHGKTFSAFEGKDAYLNDKYFEILWKEKIVEKDDNVKNEIAETGKENNS